MLLLIWIYYQVVTEQHTKHLILEACHNDRVGGHHFGRDETAEKYPENSTGRVSIRIVTLHICILIGIMSRISYTLLFTCIPCFHAKYLFKKIKK